MLVEINGVEREVNWFHCTQNTVQIRIDGVNCDWDVPNVESLSVDGERFIENGVYVRGLVKCT